MSGLKGIEKEEARRRERKSDKFRTDKKSLESRIEKNLIENKQWYKTKRDDGEDEAEGNREGETRL